uniref:Si:dkey-4p15.5 n=1 Tax=Nothobranchius furzeri TaxID=105023 RepID=A0A8C6NJL5_NOTFU
FEKKNLHHLTTRVDFEMLRSVFWSLLAYTDISVTCGTQDVSLSIYLCPIYYADYNESLMVLNNHINNPLCYGTADWTVSPPVLKFSFPINDSFFSSCGIIYQVFYLIWADFSNVQTVNISGMVTAVDPSVDVISYRQQILYKFSCAYPLQYLLNNTEVTVSGANVAIRDENATFTSTLSMQLYKDKLYKEVLIIPPTGLKVMSRIYVKVDATNLTANCNVEQSNKPVAKRDLFLHHSCTCDQRTKVVCNGVSQTAHFNFETFRFVEQINQTISTFYVHCTTRLCDVATCRDLMPVSDSDIQVQSQTPAQSKTFENLKNKSPADFRLCNQQIRLLKNRTECEPGERGLAGKTCLLCCAQLVHLVARQGLDHFLDFSS